MTNLITQSESEGRWWAGFFVVDGSHGLCANCNGTGWMGIDHMCPKCLGVGLAKGSDVVIPKGLDGGGPEPIDWRDLSLMVEMG